MEPGKNTGVGCHFLLQEIFLNQRSNPRLLGTLHCRQILYPLSHQGSPYKWSHIPDIQCRTLHSSFKFLAIIIGSWINFKYGINYQLFVEHLLGVRHSLSTLHTLAHLTFASMSHAGTIIILSLQVRNLRPREVK